MRRIDPRVQHGMAAMALDPKTRDMRTAEVAEQLQQQYGPNAISLRTVQAEWPRLRDTSQEWTLRPGDPDPAFTLAALAWSASVPGRTEPLLSVERVAWLRVVHAACPDLSPRLALTAAGHYLMAEKVNDPDYARQLSIALGSGADVEARLATAFGRWVDRTQPYLPPYYVNTPEKEGTE